MPQDLTTLASVKQHLGLTQSDDDALLCALIAGATAGIIDWLGRDPRRQSYEEVRDGNGKTRMCLLQYPVLSVERVAVNGQPIAPAPDMQSSGWRCAQGLLILQGHCFVKGWRNVVVQYTAGLCPLPPSIGQACNQLVAQRYKEREWVGLQSKVLAGETISYASHAAGLGQSVADGGMPPSVLSLLNAHKRVVPGYA